jgi:DNA polymerase V
MTERKVIPIAGEGEISSCAGGESFALMVLGDSMLPEFAEGDIIIIEPEGLAKDGSFVFAWANEEYIFRQLMIEEERWYLRPLNEAYPILEIPGKEAIKGVITQKKKPGKRREHKTYI